MVERRFHVPARLHLFKGEDHPETCGVDWPSHINVLGMTSKPATPHSKPRIPHTAGLSASMPWLGADVIAWQPLARHRRCCGAAPCSPAATNVRELSAVHDQSLNRTREITANNTRHTIAGLQSKDRVPLRETHGREHDIAPLEDDPVAGGCLALRRSSGPCLVEETHEPCPLRRISRVRDAPVGR